MGHSGCHFWVILQKCSLWVKPMDILNIKNNLVVQTENVYDNHSSPYYIFLVWNESVGDDKNVPCGHHTVGTQVVHNRMRVYYRLCSLKVTDFMNLAIKKTLL